jgi:rubrerythrin
MKVDKEGMILQLSNLLQLDVDAAQAYQEAIKNIEVTNIRDQLSNFREDHLRHIKELSAEIRNLGGTPPIAKPGLKGFILDTFTELQSATGTEGALTAMRGNEELTNDSYRAALDYELPDEIRTLLERNFKDEQRHLRYIEKVLEHRAWEHKRAAGNRA